MAFSDLFSDEADLYVAARPRYPDSLFEFIASAAPATDCAWDCGTGNGQAAVSLARYFKSVYATDPSASQIAHAIPCAGVAYSVQPAETTDFPASTFDAICVAQALHWLNLPEFFIEAQRVMMPGAIFAAWGYSWFTVSPEFDAVFREVVLEVIALDWAPQNVLLWRGFRDINMPFQPIQPPNFAIEATWNLHQLLAYVHTWSATRRCIERIGRDFFERAATELVRHWGPPATVREVAMPLHLLVGRNIDNQPSLGSYAL